MPELRTDWLTGRTVLVAVDRANRPNEFAADVPTGNPPIGDAALAAGRSPDCPFCVGNESRTPPAVYEQIDARGHWQVRVVPNKFPAVTEPARASVGGVSDAEFAVQADGPSASKSPPTVCPALGAHEVIIESARHVDRMSALSVAELRDVLEAYACRLRHWRDDGRFGYGLVFKNQGAQAGASLTHVHSQLMALPFVPPIVERELVRAEDQFQHHERCAYCRLILGEQSHGERVVLDCNGYVAFCPFASLQPLETWLLPTSHEPWFEAPSRPDAIDRLAAVVHDLTKRLEAVVPGASYNMILRTAPWQPGVDQWQHWRIEFLPRFTSLAGLELAAGVHINPLPPEQASHLLRDPAIFS